jgi:hypothetical protein
MKKIPAPAGNQTLFLQPVAVTILTELFQVLSSKSENVLVAKDHLFIPTAKEGLDMLHRHTGGYTMQR